MTNGRAEETNSLLKQIVDYVTEFLKNAECETALHRVGEALPATGTSLVPAESLLPLHLKSIVSTSLDVPIHGIGEQGILRTCQDIFKYSVNTSAPGFLDKLYAAPLPPGIAAELILGVLNTNLHVYQVSPVLTLVEKNVTKALAKLFGLRGPRAGGISVQGGSASNLTSIVAARNSIFPETKKAGNGAINGGQLTLFTSMHGHYSIEKAAQALGFGSQNVIAIGVDKEGRLIPNELEKAILVSKAAGQTPFYINATAGTTVLGSFDPFHEIASIAVRHRCWLHVDGAWGGSFAFSSREDLLQSLNGIERANSIAINPHKMLGIPVTCSFLLTQDLRLFQAAMTLRAGYLFHDSDDVDDETDIDEVRNVHGAPYGPAPFDTIDDSSDWSEPNDLADLTLQCGRRGDSLKFFLSWQYYGTAGYAEKVDHAYNVALHLSAIVDGHCDLRLALGAGTKPACLQVCFYYTPGGCAPFGTIDSRGLIARPRIMRRGEDQLEEYPKPWTEKRIGKYNTLVTSMIARNLIQRGFMIDFAPALDGQEDRGSFFRVVVNISTIRETTERLVTELVQSGSAVVTELQLKYGTEVNLIDKI